MTDLEHSARKLLRATYSPINSTRTDAPSRQKAWAKYSLVANLQIMPAELDRLASDLGPNSRIMLALKAVVQQDVTASALENVPLFTEVNWDSLVSMTEGLVKLRQQDLDEFRSAYQAIIDAYEHRVAMQSSGVGDQGDVTPGRESEL